MKNILNHDICYERFFEEMTRIPHGSCHEQQYSDYLVQFAKDRGLRWKQYEIGNVIIYKEASDGYENHPPVILQAHMDMVCEKESWSEHDFLKDPLDIYLEDGWLKARGTTLGADDGTGVAYMLAILDDDSLAHPPLECVFTVMEEVGLDGAFAIKKEDLSASRLIGLDDGGGGKETYVSSAGGLTVTLNKAYPAVPITGSPFELTIDGLSGGHSGECISEEKGNAIKICARLLDRLQKDVPIQIGSMHGGSKDNALPRSCTATFWAPVQKDALEAIINDLFPQILAEQTATGSIPRLEIHPLTTTEAHALSAETSRAFTEMLLIMPDGFRHKNVSFPGFTSASENFAILNLEAGEVSMEISLRAMYDSHKELMRREIEIIAGLYGLDMKTSADYPGWPYREHSELREKLAPITKEFHGQELKPIAVHGGLECSIFSRLLDPVDIVTIGARGVDVHTPQERLDMESFAVTYQILIRLLREL